MNCPYCLKPILPTDIAARVPSGQAHFHCVAQVGDEAEAAYQSLGEQPYDVDCHAVAADLRRRETVRL